LGQDDNIYVLDIVRDRLNLTERCSEVMRLHRKWKPRDVRYEKYGMMADIDHIKFIQGQQNYRFSISEVGGQTAKNDRIRRLVPYFEEGRVWFPKSLHRTLHDGITRELVNEFIEQELLAFPVGRHDDMLDALARLVEPDLPLTWPKIDVPQRNERYSRRETKGSVWTA
jgi:predicted phage terminase large subunit-like protein